MIKSSKLFVAALACAIFALAPLISHATDETDTFTVSATVVDSCSITAGDLSFGNYDPTEGGDVTATSTIDITCSNGTGWTLKLCEGSAGVFTTRTMEKGTDTLNYNLYNEATHTTVWDNTVAGWVTGTGDGTAQSQTVYGKIPSGQNTAVVGAYTDTITATVTY